MWIIQRRTYTSIGREFSIHTTNYFQHILATNLDKHAAASNDRKRIKLPKLFYPSFCES